MNDSLNKILLDNTLLASLYPHSLVDLEEQETPYKKTIEEKKPLTARSELKFLGNNAAHITVVVNNSAHSFLSDEQLAFLSRMLGACNLNTGDIAIVNMSNNYEFSEVVDRLTPEKVLSFGYPLPGTALPLMGTAQVGGFLFLNAPPLEELMQDAGAAITLKTALWNTLRKIFGI